jgi:hypothetical protein
VHEIRRLSESEKLLCTRYEENEDAECWDWRRFCGGEAILWLSRAAPWGPEALPFCFLKNLPAKGDSNCNTGCLWRLLLDNTIYI